MEKHSIVVYEDSMIIQFLLVYKRLIADHISLSMSPQHRMVIDNVVQRASEMSCLG
jgi:hypothetical protein